MSIYSTEWVLRFPEHGDSHSGSRWITVLGQGVPAHIGTTTPRYGYEAGDPYSSFLPPPIPVDPQADPPPLRAIVIVREGTEKVGQEYIAPLLVLSGLEYASIPFRVLYEHICNALRGARPRVIAELMDEHGHHRLIHDDGFVKDNDPKNR